MKQKITQLLRNIGLTEEQIQDSHMETRFKSEEEFKVEVNHITIFFEGNITIEIYDDCIGFRTTEEYKQTNFTIFHFNDVKEMEFEIKGNYHYFNNEVE